MNLNKLNNTDDSITRIASILADGVYVYMKANGLLKANPERSERIKNILSENRKILRDEITDINDIY